MSILSPLTARVCLTHHWSNHRHVDAPLTDGRITEHLTGGHGVGCCPITPGASTTRCAVLDLDSHKGATPWEDMVATALRIIDALAEVNLHAIPFRSSGGAGIHLVLLWNEPQDAYSVREELRIALGKCSLKSGVRGVAEGEVEIFPKQNEVPVGGCGSMFVLPLNNKSRALMVSND